MPRILYFLIAALMLLGACAPGVKGSSSVYTLNLDTEDPTVSAGATWYFSSDYAPRSFGIELPQDWPLQGASFGSTYRSNQGSRFTVTQVGLPEAWEFNMYSTTGLQKVTNVNKTDSSVSVEWNERIQFVFRAYIPANTPSGTYEGLVTITAGDKTKLLPVRIVVDGVSPVTGSQS